jgi:hypothetical protein
MGGRPPENCLRTTSVGVGAERWPGWVVAVNGNRTKTA